MQNLSKPQPPPFDQFSQEWWDPQGPYAVLHRLNPLRLFYLKSRLQIQGYSLKSLRVLDVGCGGGILAEPLCRLGASVTGLDLDDSSISCAQKHASEQNLPITYYREDVQDFSQKNPHLFNCVTAFEVMEHIEDIEKFLQGCKLSLAPEGQLFLSTFNRTWKSYIYGIWVAESLLKWVPQGMHEWSMFLKPSELVPLVASLGFHVEHIQGYAYDLFSDTWKMTEDLSVNYMLSAYLKP